MAAHNVRICSATLDADSLHLVPLTAVTIGACTAIWFYLWNYDVQIERFGYQYQKVVAEHEWWRAISASFAHTSPLHLIFNMMALWNSATMEIHYGWVTYLKYSFLLVLLSMVAVTVFYYLAIHHFERDYYRHVYSLGYSCVVFGWMMIQCETCGGQMSIFGLRIPARLAPFASLLITQLIVPRASFIGHLSGIIVGEVIALGFFSWFIDPLFWATFAVFVGAAAYTLRPILFQQSSSPQLGRTNRLRPGGWEAVPAASDDEETAVRTEMKIVNGVLVRSS
mmetsp:Transcript_40660/g.66112  ORF Transcript_40660/g.66112 Transcript_40660/m.66112 type:complete len:281 (-) Transcript_40660:77-919(-)